MRKSSACPAENCCSQCSPGDTQGKFTVDCVEACKKINVCQPMSLGYNRGMLCGININFFSRVFSFMGTMAAIRNLGDKFSTEAGVEGTIYPWLPYLRGTPLAVGDSLMVERGLERKKNL